MPKIKKINKADGTESLIELNKALERLLAGWYDPSAKEEIALALLETDIHFHTTSFIYHGPAVKDQASGLQKMKEKGQI